VLDNKDRKMPAAFYRLWAGEGVSVLAGSWGTMANSWLVYQWTGSPAAIGTMWLFYFLPSLLIQWGVGPYLDRWDRSQLLSWCQWSRSLAFLLPLSCIWAQWEASWLLYLTVAWTGTVQALYTPSTQALLPALVQQTSLTQANARIDATFRLMNMIGPILGGGAVAAAGVEINLIGVVIFYAWGGWILSRLPSVGNPKTTTLPSWKKGIREGFHVFTRDPVLIVLTGCLAVIQWAVAVLIVLGLPYVTDEMNRGALAYGWFLAGFSIGYLLGSMGVSRWKGGTTSPCCDGGSQLCRRGYFYRIGCSATLRMGAGDGRIGRFLCPFLSCALPAPLSDPGTFSCKGPSLLLARTGDAVGDAAWYGDGRMDGKCVGDSCNTCRCRCRSGARIPGRMALVCPAEGAGIDSVRPHVLITGINRVSLNLK
jgi:MFS family permease